MLADSLAAVLHVAVQHMLKIVVVDPGALHFAARVSSGAGGGRRLRSHVSERRPLNRSVRTHRRCCVQSHAAGEAVLAVTRNSKSAHQLIQNI